MSGPDSPVGGSTPGSPRQPGPLGRRAFLRTALAASAGGAALYAVGCGSDGDRGTPSPEATAESTPGSRTPSSTANPTGITPRLLTLEFVAHQDNRFAVGLLDSQNQLVKDAGVHLRFFTIGADGATGTFRGEGDATLAELNFEDEATSTAFYTINTPFDAAGRWGVEITATPRDGAPSTIQTTFDVREASRSPALGAVPPASVNDTVATNPDTESLCTRVPICGLHDTVIADLLGKGRPLVVQFSTPAFCETRFCGPVLDVLLQQVPAYRDRIDFVHIEVWQDFQLRRYRPAVQEWNLPGEPYTFFMAGDGRVAGKLESIFSEEELASALDQLAALA
jgi:hypothetical protein